MQALNRLVAKHKWISFLLLTVFLCSVYSFFLIYFSMPIWSIVLCDAVLIFINYCFVTSCQNILMKKALQPLNHNCDPYPLLAETRQLLACKSSGPARQLLLINHGVALRSVGAYQEVFDTLRAINIDKYASTPPYIKIVYYNNLMDICALLGQYEQASLLYTKIKQMYSDIENKKQKQYLEPIMLNAEALDHFCKLEYEQALQILDGLHHHNLRAQVESAMLYANVCLALGDTQKAAEKLDFVISKGNFLYCVKEAQKLSEGSDCHGKQ